MQGQGCSNKETTGEGKGKKLQADRPNRQNSTETKVICLRFQNK